MIDFHYNTGPNPRKVALFLEEAGLAYRPIPLDTRKGEQHQPAYLAINPNGKAPAIVDDGVATEMAVAAAETITRVLPPPTSPPDWSADPGLGRIRAFVETTTVWHPQGV